MEYVFNYSVVYYLSWEISILFPIRNEKYSIFSNKFFTSEWMQNFQLNETQIFK